MKQQHPNLKRCVTTHKARRTKFLAGLIILGNNKYVLQRLYGATDSELFDAVFLKNRIENQGGISQDG